MLYLYKMDTRVRHGSMASDAPAQEVEQGTGSSYLAVTMRNIIKSTLTHDDTVREPLKPWRRRIRDLCNELNTSVLENILSNTVDARYIEFVEDKNVLSVKEKEEDEEDYTDLCLKNKKVLEDYLISMENMFESYKKVEDTITNLEELEHEFIGLSCLDEGDEAKETASLKNAIQAFIQKKYEDSKLTDEFNAFKLHYKNWKLLRSVILQAHVGQEINGGAYCSICTTERVNTALIPCGHTYCNNCGQKQKSACFICRTSVSGRLRIFFT